MPNPDYVPPTPADEFHVLDFLDGLVDRQLIELRQFVLRQRKRRPEMRKRGTNDECRMTNVEWPTDACPHSSFRHSSFVISLRRPRLGRPTHGFTLFEVILSIALAAVLTLIGTAINLYLEQIDSGRTRVEEAQLARSILSMIADDIRKRRFTNRRTRRPSPN